MQQCVKCKTLIKPASLTTFIRGEAHHPQCISCALCDRLLFGKSFKKNRDGSMICEGKCQPKPSENNNNGNQSTQDNQRWVNLTASPSLPPPPQQETPRFDPEQYRRVPAQNSTQPPTSDYHEDLSIRMQASRLDSNPSNKICKLCERAVTGRRFVTYESGDVICYDCDVKSVSRPARVKSAHIIICSSCNNAVHGRRYITEPSGKILCDNCEKNAPRCHKCNLIIGLDADSKKLSNNAQYHQECFSCSSCNTIINEPEFYETPNKEPLCLKCFEITKLPKCKECKKPISVGYYMIDNQPIHKACFKCSQCGDGISPDIGYFKNQLTNLPVCQKCHLINTGVKCCKCGKIIEKDGCTFNDRDYHQNCFLCTFCNVELIKMKKTYRGRNDEEILCEPCFTDRYAPRCAKCTQAISPNRPSTKYEDQMYHLECLACSRCKKTLANKKFFKTGNLQICESCYH